jgi:hypothetical protein
MHEFMNRPWYAIIDDLIGGWAVATIDLPTSQIERRLSEEFVVIDLCLDEDVARHVAELHNARLAITDVDGAAQAAYDALMYLKEVAELNEVQDDAVQDVLDLLWGWCAPSMRIGPGVNDEPHERE